MKDYEAIIEILKAESDITDVVAKMVNNDRTASTLPAIVFGDLPESQNVYPAISVRRLPKDKYNGVEIGSFIIDCWSDGMTDSTDLAELVDELFTDADCFASGYAFHSYSDILGTVTDGTYFNTPVNIRTNYIRR